jgi:serine/threonine protein kinase
MPLAPNSKLGPYEIKSTLGVGGMGEVYRARDSRLNRDVAIKVLRQGATPGSSAASADLRSRLERVDRASLGKLLDSWTISRYELQPDRIVFYLWSSAADGGTFTFRFTPRYAVRAKAAPAKLADYYNPDLNAVIAPQSFVVRAIP